MKKIALLFFLFLCAMLLAKKGHAVDTLSSVDLEKDSADIYVFSDIPQHNPEFVGGFIALKEFYKNNIEYPADARAEKIQGTVLVQFLVDVDSTLSNIKVVKGISPSIDKEAIRIVSKMPKWKPGEVQVEKAWKRTKLRYTLPVVFNLTEK